MSISTLNEHQLLSSTPSQMDTSDINMNNSQTDQNTYYDRELPFKRQRTLFVVVVLGKYTRIPLLVKKRQKSFFLLVENEGNIFKVTATHCKLS